MSRKDEYPDWRTALFGNDHAANLRCFGKYILWHGFHFVLAAGMVGIFTFIAGLKAIGQLLLYIPRGIVMIEIPSPTGEDKEVMDYIKHPMSKKISKIIFISLAGLLVAAFFGSLIYSIYTAPVESVQVIVVALVFLTMVVIGMAILQLLKLIKGFTVRKKNKALNNSQTYKKTRKRLNKASQRSKEKKVLRRVYGHCPVDIDLEPKWFTSFSDDVLEIYEDLGKYMDRKLKPYEEK